MSTAPKTLHLIERAAERLRDDGTADPTAASLFGERPQAAPGSAHAKPARPDLDVAPIRISAAQLEAAGMIGSNRRRSRIAEEFRIIQGQILRAAFASDGGGSHLSNLVMVTSTRASEGKSFAAFNIAASIARQKDHPVLLVDADFKPDSIGGLLGLSGQPGLLDLAADPHLDPDSVISPTEIEKLFVLGIGETREHGADLLATRHMARLVRELGRRYSDRLVIIDAPPCLASSDPSTLASIVGQTIFVVEAEKTQRDEVESALDLIQACPSISLLLNKVQMETRNSFGSYAPYYQDQA